MLPEYALDVTPTNLSRLQTSKFFNVAALAALAFDYCLTFSTEVEYVWGTKWEATRVVFTISRYLSFVSSALTCYDALFDEKCASFIFALDVVSILFAEGILILRTWALWARNKRVLIFLLVLLAALVIAAEVLSLLVNISLPGDLTSYYQIYPFACAYLSPRGSAFQFALLMAYEIILQGMNSWRKFRTYRNLHSRLLNTLYWDGVVYMWWIIVFSGANMIVLLAAPVAYVPALHTAQVAIHSVLASRIFFNLRQSDKETTLVRDEISLETLHYQVPSTASATTQAETIS